MVGVPAADWSLEPTATGDGSHRNIILFPPEMNVRLSFLHGSVLDTRKNSSYCVTSLSKLVEMMNKVNSPTFYCTDKKKNKFSSYIRKFRMEQLLQSHD
jgi:hypothetical protein